MTHDKPVPTGRFVLDVVGEVVLRQVSLREEQEKADAVRTYQIGEVCPRNLGDDTSGREIDPSVAQTYPTGQQAKFPYTHETPTHKVRVRYMDGHHPDNRDNLTDAQIGVGTQHVHDDWKRSPPEILDQDPEQNQVGRYAKKRLPDSADVYSVPGDQLPGSE